MSLPFLPPRWSLLAVVAVALAILVCVGTPKAGSAGDFAGPLDNARALLAGRDPLAIPPADDRHIPYLLTAATFALPLTLLPPLVISVLVTAMLVVAIGVFSAGVTNERPWQPLLLLAYVPLIFNLQLIQWAPLLLLAVALHRWLVRLDDRGSRWAWAAAGLVCVPLIVKAQLLPILALPVVALLLVERRWRVLAVLWLGGPGCLGFHCFCGRIGRWCGGSKRTCSQVCTPRLPLRSGGSGCRWWCSLWRWPRMPGGKATTRRCSAP